jgi:uncharacterized repeat protein (TIGR03803 family)
LSDSTHPKLNLYTLAARERSEEEIMTSSRTNSFNRPRSLVIGSAFIFAIWLTTAIASPAQTLTTLFSFDGADGIGPDVLIQARDGNYYGTTYYGGANSCKGSNYGCGTAFRITSTGALTTLYNFCSLTNCTDGFHPNDLVLGLDGNLYGTTNSGGAYGFGTVFKITPTGKLTTLHSFCARSNCPGGDFPDTLLQATDGNFYSTNFESGRHGQGTVFKITLTGTLTTLYAFCAKSNCSDGANPAGELIQYGGGSKFEGDFYGTTVAGGLDDNNNCSNGGCGTVFKITPKGTLTTLYQFCSQSNCTDGAFPYAGLTKAAAGDLHFYGITYGGGFNIYDCYGGCGTVFKITPKGTLTTLYQFCSQSNCPDGANPVAGLVLGTDGNYYGTTTFGGAYGDGTIFRITPTGTLTTLYNFCSQSNCEDGSNPWGVFQATSGTFYGSTSQGGSHNDGTVYSLNMGLGPFVSLVRNSGKVGAQVEILGQGFTGTTAVSFNGTAAQFVVHSDTYLTAKVPTGASTGFVTVTTPGGVLQSSTKFWVQ